MQDRVEPLRQLAAPGFEKCSPRYSLIGLDIGGTKTAVIEGTLQADVVQRLEFATLPQRGLQATLDELYATIDRVQALAEQQGRCVQAVSVSIGGPLDIERGIIYSPPNLPGWDAVPLKALLSERFGRPVFVEHDGNAGALAEWRFGAGQGARSLIFLTMGTGLGGGLILDGRLYRGASDMAGEVGHMRIADHGPVAYGKAGSWEAFCTGPALAQMAQETYPARFARAGAAVTTPELVRLALAGDAEAVEVVQRVGDYLGRGLAVLVDILNPERIVIGSMAVRLGELLLGPARIALQREALPRAAAVCQVVPAALGERIGDVASLCAAIEALSA